MGTESAVATSIIDLERTALERFGRGDIEGPLAVCDDDISYFDPFVARRIDGRSTLASHYEAARGEVQYDSFELEHPRVQAFEDTAILSYVLATTGPPGATDAPSRWKVTTVYHRSNDRWRVVHSHFALFAGSSPRDVEFTSPPADLGRLEGRLLRELLGLEDAASAPWRRGDPWGFWELSAPQISYFDPETDGRVDGAEGLRRVYAAGEGTVLYDVSESVAARVAVFGDVAVLSYQYRSAATLDDGSVGSTTRWNTTEVFARIDGLWRLVHTHWSYALAGLGEVAEHE
jgi:ketosteroid isomerase-like protein